MKTTMAILSSFVLILLTGCQFRQKNMDKSLTDSYSFEFNEKCPNICWLGISPGKTTPTEVGKILARSSQIDWNLAEVFDERVITTWYLDKQRHYSSTIGVEFEAGVVKTIDFTSLPYTLNDFIEKVGEPDKIRLRMVVAERNLIQYVVYFSSRKVVIEAFADASVGPDPTDSNLFLWLNADIDYNPLSDRETVQRWQGYGHLQVYLSGNNAP